MTCKGNNYLQKKCKSTIILLLLCNLWVAGQDHSNRFFFSGSEIVVDVLPGNDIFYSHTCDKGINVYDLAEVFQINAEKLLRENKLNPKSPNNDGKIVKIPVAKNIIVSNANMSPGKLPHLKVKYQVKKGDNLFRIAKDYFSSDVATLTAINGKKSTDIKLGEELLIGWILVKDKKPKTSQQTNPKHLNNSDDSKVKPKSEGKAKSINEQTKTSVTSNQTKPSIVEKTDDVKIIKYFLSDVIGYWDRNAENSKSFFVLHDEAKVGSILDIYNPMLKTHVKAKVLGKIPLSTYAEDIQIIISPAVAKELGILDARFKVNIKYEQ